MSILLLEHLQSVNKNIYFYTDTYFEHWDFTNPMLIGIGGSETSQIEMSSRLASRGHNVISYAPVAWKGERTNRNVKWTSFTNATFKEDGLWIIYRVPKALDNFDLDHKGKEIWFIAQDVFYDTMTEERGAKIDKYICLCPDHKTYIEYKYPYLVGKILVSSNGINVDLINAISANNKIERNPHRLIYSSSPDRGLEQLIPIFKRAKEFIPDLELHVFYGFDNIDKIIERMPWVERLKDSIMNSIKGTDGIFWHGRIGQIELIIEWLKSGIWCYPVNFTETSCISCMEAQACGVIPIASPVWALRDNIQHGILIPGSIEDKLTLAKFVGSIIRICNNSSGIREKIVESGKMELEAKVRFNWERYVDQWEGWMYQPKCRYFFTQFAFQQKWAIGKILNVGCDIDSSEFGVLRNADNLDVVPHEGLKVNIIANILNADTRKIINKLYDTVIVGDLLEHTVDDDQAIRILINASYGLKDNNSLLIITCPEDHRPKEIQNPTFKGDEIYFGGLSQFHRLIKYEELEDIISKAGLNIVDVQQIDCTHYKEWGILCQI